MGLDEWRTYTQTSTKNMLPLDRPFSAGVTQQLAKERSSGARDGWKLEHVDSSGPRWSMTDKITYRLPNHTTEVPDVAEESLKDAISAAYHLSYTLHRRLMNKTKKDVEAGKKLSRSSRKPKKK